LIKEETWDLEEKAGETKNHATQESEGEKKDPPMYQKEKCPPGVRIRKLRTEEVSSKSGIH